MEKRVQELEKNFLQAAISLATIRTKLDTLPDKDWVTTRIFWAVGAFAGPIYINNPKLFTLSFKPANAGHRCGTATRTTDSH